MFRWRVEASGDVLTPLLNRLREPKAALEAAGRELVGGKEQAFDDEGPGWAQLAPLTVAMRQGQAHPILVWTGAYKASWIAEVDDSGVTLLSRDPRAPVHQFGGLTEDGHRVPARPVDVSEVYIELAIDALMFELLK